MIRNLAKLAIVTSSVIAINISELKNVNAIGAGKLENLQFFMMDK